MGKRVSEETTKTFAILITHCQKALDQILWRERDLLSKERVEVLIID
jgi:hypothetical protein